MWPQLKVRPVSRQGAEGMQTCPSRKTESDTALGLSPELLLSPTLAVLESSLHNKAEEVLSLFLLFLLSWTRAPSWPCAPAWTSHRPGALAGTGFLSISGPTPTSQEGGGGHQRHLVAVAPKSVRGTTLGGGGLGARLLPRSGWSDTLGLIPAWGRLQFTRSRTELDS